MITEGADKEETKSDAKYFCRSCHMFFDTRRGFDMHMSSKHQVLSIRARSQSPMEDLGKKQEQESICRYCQCKFSTASNLDRHLKSEVCIKREEGSPVRDLEEEKSFHKRRKIPEVRMYEVKVINNPLTILRIIGDYEDSVDGLNFLLPVYRISKPLYRWERVGSAAYKFGTQDSLLSTEDQKVYKSICSVLDGAHEVKIYSNDITFLPPELKDGYWCTMCFYGVRLTKTAKASYLSINEKGGWKIECEDGEAMYASGVVGDSSVEWKTDPELVYRSAEMKYVSQANFYTFAESTATPWLSFAIDRIHGFPDLISQLNSEQKGVANLIMNEIDGVNKPYDKVNRGSSNVHFINGLPGTGKSFLLEALFLYCRSKGVNCKVVAFTKMVANMYNEGATLHSYFRIPFKKGRIEPEGTKATPSKGNLYSIVNLRVLFIDEICCIRLNLLDIIDDCLRSVHNPKVPFGGILVIAAGDFHQLPPVNNNDENGRVLDSKQCDSFSSAKAFKKAKFYTLEVPCRVHPGGADGRLIKLMMESMTKQLIQFDSSIMLSDLRKGIEFVYGKQTAWPQAFTNGNALICFTNTAAFEVNSAVLAMWKKQSVDALKKKMKAKAYAASKSEPKSLKNRALNKVNPELLMEGTPLFCTKNIKEGLVNGAQVIYKGTVEGPRGGKYLFVTELNSKMEGRNYLVGTGGSIHPFDWGFSLTVHKAQGRTFNKACLVFIGEEEPFIHGQLTVALTRVRSLDDLRIIKTDNTCRNPIDASIIKVANDIKKKALNIKH